MHETELVVDMPNMELLVDTPNPGWHTAPGGGYGDMHGAGGHLATPKRVPVDNATTIRAVEHRIAVTRHEIATLQANLAVDEEWLNDLKQDG